jgi:hypothetical protein
MPGPDLLARINRLLGQVRLVEAELLELRAGIAAANGADVTNDFAAENLIEISTAVERFNRPADTLRWLCRTEGVGRKLEGRWKISVPALMRLKRE